RKREGFSAAFCSSDASTTADCRGFLAPGFRALRTRRVFQSDTGGAITAPGALAAATEHTTTHPTRTKGPMPDKRGLEGATPRHSTPVVSAGSRIRSVDR